MRTRILGAIIVTSAGVVGGCGESVSDTVAPRPAVATKAADTARHSVTITRAEYGDAWPFTVDSGVLTGRARFGRRDLAEVTFTAEGKTYYVNGIAKGTRSYAELTDIWAWDSRTRPDTAIRMNMGPIIDRGLKLARGIDEEFVATERIPPPATLVAEPVRCDRFDISASFVPIENGDAKRAKISVSTDLPDNTELMVRIGRAFRNAADSEGYSVAYFEEKSTVGDWRAGKLVELDHTIWEARLGEKQATFRKIGERLVVTDLDDAVTFSFVVPVNQTDSRFGRLNSNLVGSAVENSNGLRIVTSEFKLDWPVSDHRMPKSGNEPRKPK